SITASDGDSNRCTSCRENPNTRHMHAREQATYDNLSQSTNGYGVLGYYSREVGPPLQYPSQTLSVGVTCAHPLTMEYTVPPYSTALSYVGSPGPIYRYVIGTFKTCSTGPTAAQALTDQMELTTKT